MQKKNCKWHLFAIVANIAKSDEGSVAMLLGNFLSTHRSSTAPLVVFGLARATATAFAGANSIEPGCSRNEMHIWVNQKSLICDQIFASFTIVLILLILF